MWFALFMACHGPPPPTPPACDVAPHGMRRLTRGGYGRVVTDLLGEDRAWGAQLPAEAGGYEGWEDAQPTSAALVRAWDEAARTVADAILERGPVVQRLEPEQLGLDGGAPLVFASDPQRTWWSVSIGDAPYDIPWQFEAPIAGTYAITVRAVWTDGFQNNPFAPELHWTILGVDTDVQSVQTTFETPSELTWEVALPAGPVDAVLHLGALETIHPSVAIDAATVTTPVDDPRALDGPIRRRLVPCLPDPDDARPCAAAVLTGLARRAWRRPVAPEDADALVGLVVDGTADGAPFDEALHTALRAVFTSPYFLYRYEDQAGMAPGDARPATDHELAERLAHLAWGSVPDTTLAGCADAGGLSGAGECGLAAQLRRMLDDPRADALAGEFGRQWLQLGDVESGPRTETLAVLRALQRSDADLLDVVDLPWTIVEPDLAVRYGLPPVAGRIDLPDGRRGLLGHASILTATSLPDRTSPVLRGAWILDHLLCDPPDPPPDGVPVLPAAAAAGDVRSALEAHRASPACAGCHAAIDPLGLALEGFDPTGAARTAYPDGQPVRTDGVLDGAPIDGPVDLAAALRADPRARACLASQFASWALERPLTDADRRCVVPRLQAQPSLPGMLDTLLRDPALRTVVAR